MWGSGFSAFRLDFRDNLLTLPIVIKTPNRYPLTKLLCASQQLSSKYVSASFFNSSLSSSFSFFPICFGVFPPVHKDTGGGSSFFRLRHLHGVGRLQMRLRFSPYFNRFLPVLLHAPLARQECVVYNIYAVRLVGGRSVRWRNSLQGFAASVIFPVRHTPCRYHDGQHQM